VYHACILINSLLNPSSVDIVCIMRTVPAAALNRLPGNLQPAKFFSQAVASSG
jgi:hypothetical protein